MPLPEGKEYIKMLQDRFDGVWKSELKPLVDPLRAHLGDPFVDGALYNLAWSSAMIGANLTTNIITEMLKGVPAVPPRADHAE